MPNYSSVSIDGSVPHASRWLDARNSAADFIQIAVPAGLSGTLTIEGTDDTAVVLAENALSPSDSDGTAATVTDITSSCTFDGPLTGAGPKLLTGSYSGSKTFVRVKWVQASGTGRVTVLVSDQATQYESELDDENVSRGAIDVRFFVPEGETLDSSNVLAAIESARAVAYGLTSEAEGWCYDVYVPASRYVVESGGKIYFPPTGSTVPTPRLVGDGCFKTLFVSSGLEDDEFFLQLGATDDADFTDANYTLRHGVRGIGIIGASGAAPGGGISASLTYELHLSDIYVFGFQTDTGPVESGIGIKLSGLLHQHLRLSDVTVQGCVRGFDLGHIAQAEFTHVSSFQNQWLGVTLNQCSGLSWHGGNLQNESTANADRPYALAEGDGYTVVSGFDYTTGLDSGTGATLSTTSGGLCTLTGLTGLDKFLDRGRWIRLTDPTPGTPDKASWVYKIAEVLSATSCRIYKASNHTSQTVDWQICSCSGGNYVSFGGEGYDEGEKRATFGFFRDEVTSSSYVVRDWTAANCTYPVDADGCGQIHVSNIHAVSTLAVRTRAVPASQVDYPISQIVFDDFSYRGLDCFAVSTAAGTRTGRKDGTGGRAKRLRSLVEELGAADAWDARLTSSLDLATLDVNGWDGFINGSTLAFVNAGSKPQYVASDAGLASAAIQITGGAGAAIGSMTGVIDSDNLPTTPFTGCLFAVVRLDTDTAPAASTLTRIEARTADFNVGIGLHDSALGSSDFYGVIYDGTGNMLVELPPTADTDPHAFVVSGMADPVIDGIKGSSDYQDSDYVNGNFYTNKTPSFNLSGDVTINLAPPYDTNSREFFVAFLAFFPRALTQAEHRQLIDLARNEFPLVP